MADYSCRSSYVHLQHYLSRSFAFSFHFQFYLDRRSFQIRYAVHFHMVLPMCLVQGWFCLSSLSLPGQRQDISNSFSIEKKTTEVNPTSSEDYRRSSKASKDCRRSPENFRRFPKITRQFFKVTEDFRKSPEDFRRLSKISEDYLKTAEDFRKVAKVAEDKPKIFERFQKDCERLWKSSKYSFQAGPSSHSIPL